MTTTNTTPTNANLGKTVRETLLGLRGLLFEKNEHNVRNGFLAREEERGANDDGSKKYVRTTNFEVAGFGKKDRNGDAYLSLSIAGGLVSATLRPSNGKYGSILSGSVMGDDSIKIVARPMGYKQADGDLTEDAVNANLPKRLSISVYESKPKADGGSAAPSSTPADDNDLPF